MTTVCMGVWSVSWTGDCPIVQTGERGMSSSISTSLLMMATRELTQGRLIMIITHPALSSNRYVLFSEFRLSSVIYSWLMGEWCKVENYFSVKYLQDSHLQGCLSECWCSVQTSDWSTVSQLSLQTLSTIHPGFSEPHHQHSSRILLRVSKHKGENKKEWLYRQMQRSSFVPWKSDYLLLDSCTESSITSSSHHHQV